MMNLQSTLDTSNFKGLGKYVELSVVRGNQITMYTHHFGVKLFTFNSSINRSLYGAISLINYEMNWPKNQLTFEIETLKFLRYRYSPDIMTIFHFLRQKKMNIAF